MSPRDVAPVVPFITGASLAASPLPSFAQSAVLNSGKTGRASGHHRGVRLNSAGGMECQARRKRDHVRTRVRAWKRCGGGRLSGGRCDDLCVTRDQSSP